MTTEDAPRVYDRKRLKTILSQEFTKADDANVYIQIFRIIKQNNIPFTKKPNDGGILLDLSDIPDPIFNEIYNFVDRCYNEKMERELSVPFYQEAANRIKKLSEAKQADIDKNKKGMDDDIIPEPKSADFIMDSDDEYSDIDPEDEALLLEILNNDDGQMEEQDEIDDNAIDIDLEYEYSE